MTDLTEAVYGAEDQRTNLIRWYLNHVYNKTTAGKFVMGLYERYGRRVACAVKKYRLVRAILLPLFEHALKKASKVAPGVIHAA